MSPPILRDPTIICSFSCMHQGTELRFSQPAEFCRFFSLMTYQRLLPESGMDPKLAAERHTMLLEGCELTVHRGKARLFNRLDKYECCRVQVWSTLSEAEYERAYVVASGTSEGDAQSTSGTVGTDQPPDTTEQTQRAPKQHNRTISDSTIGRFKLAIFARGPVSTKGSPNLKHIEANNSKSGSTTSASSISSSGSTAATYVCIVFELDTDSIGAAHTKNGGSHLTFDFAKPHSSFPVAIYKPCEDPARSDSGRYPMIPLSPAKMNTDIRNSSTRVEKVELIFRTPAGEQRFIYRIRL
ncbi:hypothetical protein LTR15_011904 [Elasticomyces elasticus]|nr:hypothetical protein LTR15_011904 [Elasticomyces elasticus]